MFVIKFAVNFRYAYKSTRIVRKKNTLATDSHLFKRALHTTGVPLSCEAMMPEAPRGFYAYLLSLAFPSLLAHTAALISYAYHYSMTNASAGEKIIKNAHPLWQP